MIRANATTTTLPRRSSPSLIDPHRKSHWLSRRLQSLAHGAFDYLAKPVDFQYLLQSVETAVMMRCLER